MVFVDIMSSRVLYIGGKVGYLHWKACWNFVLSEHQKSQWIDRAQVKYDIVELYLMPLCLGATVVVIAANDLHAIVIPAFLWVLGSLLSKAGGVLLP